MNFEDLLQVQDELDVQLVMGDISMSDYDREWSEILAVTGWTEKEYEEQIDRRWDYIDNFHAILQKVRVKN